MLLQMVQFETSLDESDLLKVAEDRRPQYAAITTLLQKYYLKLDRPNHYGGVMVWKDRAALAAFRETDLARTVGEVYRTVRAPDVSVHEVLFPLRDVTFAQTTNWVA